MSDLQLNSAATQGVTHSARQRAAIAMLVALCCLGIRWPLLSQPAFEQDHVYFLHWASLADRGGVAAVYETRANGRPWCNYPPVYPYVLKLLAGVFQLGTGQALDGALIAEVLEHENTPRTIAARALFKMPAVVADGVTCALLVIWLSRRLSLQTAGLVSLGYAVMPAVVFDSAVWGQVDSIPTLFTLLALESTVARRWAAAGALAALAALTKPQALLFAPVYLAAIVAADPRGAFLAAGRFASAALLIATIFIAPLWPARENILRAYTEAAGYYPYIHLNGFSAWFLANPLQEPRLDALSRFYVRDDLPLFGWITARMTGFVAMGLIGIAVLARFVRPASLASAVQHAARVLPLAFVILCTQMHERYLVPAIAFWVWGYRRSWAWWIGWPAMGFVATVNLLWVWDQPNSHAAISSLAEWTRGSPLGTPTGIVCAIALIVVLLLTLTALDERKLNAPTIAAREP